MTDYYKSFPNEAADNNLTSTGLVGVAFGFNAGAVRITNEGGGAAYIRLRSTGPASTGDYKLSSGLTMEVDSIGAGIFGFSAAATSTANVLNYGAWG